jgi:transposase-like protein
MPCPHCAATTTTEVTKRTQLGYRIFRCSACQRQFNERTGTPYNYLAFPTDIVLLVVLWRLRYKLSLRDLAEMFLERGFAFTHEAVREWEARFAPLIAEQLRGKRKGQAGRSWHVDETYIKVAGGWKYLYRAIDREGNLVDSLLSEHRDMDAAKRFFRAAVDVAERAPERVTTAGHDAYPRALRETIGKEVMHHCNRYLNNRIEQDHRGIKQAITRCVASGMSTRQPASVERLMNNVSTFACGPRCGNVSRRYQNNDGSSAPAGRS